MSVRVFAPAKINLTLKVGRAKGNGRHPLQSVVVFADAGDWIEAAPADTLSLRVIGPFAADTPVGEDNLVLRAARALAQHAGTGTGAALTLEKHLPVASGIGGGSSDAAACLKPLNALWRLDLGDDDLMRLAAPLGGDVPVCVAARSAYMSGEGEVVSPLTVPALDAVLVNPRTSTSTAAVFAAFDAMDGGVGFAPAPAPAWPTRAAAIAGTFSLGNDLTAAAHTIAPALASVRAALEAAPQTQAAALSGSGATMFALTADAAAAAALAEILAKAHPHWWVRAVRLGALDGAAPQG